MRADKCKNCRDVKICRETRGSWFFFLIGIIATIAIRVVSLLMYISPLYANIAWYIGVVGFVVFFVYQFRNHHQRALMIKRERLFEKVNAQTPLTKKDYEALAIILCELRSKKERINYFFIFFSSAIALILAIYFDFIR